MTLGGSGTLKESSQGLFQICSRAPDLWIDDTGLVVRVHIPEPRQSQKSELKAITRLSGVSEGRSGAGSEARARLGLD